MRAKLMLEYTRKLDVSRKRYLHKLVELSQRRASLQKKLKCEHQSVEALNQIEQQVHARGWLTATGRQATIAATSPRRLPPIRKIAKQRNSSGEKNHYCKSKGYGIGVSGETRISDLNNDKNVCQKRTGSKQCTQEEIDRSNVTPTDFEYSSFGRETKTAKKKKENSTPAKNSTKLNDHRDSVVVEGKMFNMVKKKPAEARIHESKPKKDGKRESGRHLAKSKQIRTDEEAERRHAEARQLEEARQLADLEQIRADEEAERRHAEAGQLEEARQLALQIRTDEEAERRHAEARQLADSKISCVSYSPAFSDFSPIYPEQDLRVPTTTAKYLGDESLRDGDYNGAIRHYSLVINSCPENGVAAVCHANRASALCRLRDFGGAISDCEMAAALEPCYAKAHTRLGFASYCAADYGRAVEALNRALSLDSSSIMSRKYLARAQDRLIRSLLFRELLPPNLFRQHESPKKDSFSKGDQLRTLVEQTLPPTERIALHQDCNSPTQGNITSRLMHEIAASREFPNRSIGEIWSSCSVLEQTGRASPKLQLSISEETAFKISKLKELHERGVLSKKDYEKKIERVTPLMLAEDCPEYTSK